MHYPRVEVNTLPFTLIYLSIGRFRACDSVRFLCVRPWDEDNLYTGKHVNKVAIITERSHDSDFSQQISHSGFGNYKCRSCRSVWWFKLGFDEPNPPIWIWIFFDWFRRLDRWCRIKIIKTLKNLRDIRCKSVCSRQIIDDTEDEEQISNHKTVQLSNKDNINDHNLTNVKMFYLPPNTTHTYNQWMRVLKLIFCETIRWRSIRQVRLIC